jgi:hypothetical protein
LITLRYLQTFSHHLLLCISQQPFFCCSFLFTNCPPPFLMLIYSVVKLSLDINVCWLNNKWSLLQFNSQYIYLLLFM